MPENLWPMVGVVSGLGGLVGSWLGNKVEIAWIKQRQEKHEQRLDDHSARLRAHDVALGNQGHQS